MVDIVLGLTHCGQYMPQMYSARTVAALLGVSRQSVMIWCRKGRVKATQPAGRNGQWLIPQAELDRLLCVVSKPQPETAGDAEKVLG